MTSEQLLDILPIAVDIYDTLEMDNFRKQLPKDIPTVEAGIMGFKYVLKHSGKVKESIFEVVAIATNQTPDEVKRQEFTKTLKTLKEVFMNEEIQSFFNSAIQ